jgi:hypothetical protein
MKKAAAGKFNKLNYCYFAFSPCFLQPVPPNYYNDIFKTEENTCLSVDIIRKNKVL